MDQKKLASLEAGYDKVAGHYVERIFNELDHKPLDRLLLDRFADSIGSSARICDVGCGPGHVTNYLRQRGVDVFGIDLSSAMVDQARRLVTALNSEPGTCSRLTSKLSR